MTDLESQFHKAMLDMCEQRKAEIDYNPSIVLRMMSEHGAVEAARRIITIPDDSSGLTRLWEKHRLDLSVQALVIERRFASLFSTNDQRNAYTTLQEHGYVFTPEMDVMRS